MAAEGSPSYGPRERGLDLLLEENLYDDIDSLDDESLCLLPPAVPSLHLVPEAHPEKHGGDDAEHGLWTLGGPSRESQKLHRLELCPPDQTAAFEAVDEQGNVVIDLPQVRAAGTVGPNGGKSIDGRAQASAHPRLNGMCRWLPKQNMFEFRLGQFSLGPLTIRKRGEPSVCADLGRVLAVAPAKRRRRARVQQTFLPDGQQNPGQMQGDHPT
jgi:hypothetical protein